MRLLVFTSLNAILYNLIQSVWVKKAVGLRLIDVAAQEPSTFFNWWFMCQTWHWLATSLMQMEKTTYFSILCTCIYLTAKKQNFESKADGYTTCHSQSSISTRWSPRLLYLFWNSDLFLLTLCLQVGPCKHKQSILERAKLSCCVVV